MTLSEAILSVLLSYKAHGSDAAEPMEERTARLTAASNAIADAAKKVACVDVAGGKCKSIVPDVYTGAGVIVAQMVSESSLSKRVWVGACLAFECDPEKVKGVVRHRAAGAFQIHRAPTESVEAWEGYVGDSYEAIYKGAIRTMYLWASGAYTRAGLRLDCGYLLLGGSNLCKLDAKVATGSGPEGRARLAQSTAERLRRLSWKK